MNLVFWLVVAIAAVLVIILVAMVISRPRAKKKDANYQDALRALLDGRETDALRCLRDTVMKDTDNVDAYIRMGRLIRLRGNPEKAAQIHQSLTARSNLKREEELAIFTELVDDYVDIGRNEKAGALLKELVRVAKNKLPYLRRLLALLVSQGHTHESYDELSRHVRLFNNKSEAAAWFAEIARLEIAKGGELAADALKRAQRLDRNHPYLIGVQVSHLIKAGEKAKARSLLEKFLKLYPERAENVADTVEQVYFDLGIYDKIAGLYENLLKRYPDKREIRLRLVDLRAKEGDVKGALELIGQVLVDDPGDIGFMVERARLSLASKDIDAARDSIDKLKELLVLMPPICPECGELLEQDCWFCTGCGSMAK